MISALHEIEAVCFNRLLIPWYQIPHPSPLTLPLPIPNPFGGLLRSQTNFLFPFSSVSKELGVFLHPGWELIVGSVWSKPEKKMCDANGDGF